MKTAETLDLNFYDFDDFINEKLLLPGCLPLGIINENNSPEFNYCPNGLKPEDVTERCEMLRSYIACEKPLPRHLMNILLQPIRSSNIGFVYHRFPHIPEDLDYLLENEIYPDIIVHIEFPVPTLLNNLTEVVANRWRMKLATIVRRRINDDAAARQYWKERSEVYFMKAINQILRYHELFQFYLDKLENGILDDEGLFLLSEDPEHDEIQNIDYLSLFIEEQQKSDEQFSDSMIFKKISFHDVAYNLSVELDRYYNFGESEQKYRDPFTMMKPEVTPSIEIVQKLLNFMNSRSCSFPSRSDVAMRIPIYFGKDYFFIQFYKRADEQVRNQEPRINYDAEPKPYFVEISVVRSALEERLKKEVQILNKIKERAIQERIPVLDYNNMTEETLIETVSTLKRQPGHFEQTYEINLSQAESLINDGVYYISNFGRRCPVEMLEGKYRVHQQLNYDKLFTVIHKKYVYFLGSSSAKDKFQADPLKYIKHPAISPLIIINILIIGPPQCGKTTLAGRLSKRLGLSVITLQNAIDYVVNNMQWCSLAKEITDSLKECFKVTPHLCARAVHAATMTKSASTHGWVLTDVPVVEEFFEALQGCNIVPNLTFYIKTDGQAAVNRLIFKNEIELPSYDNEDRLHEHNPLVLQLRLKEWNKMNSLASSALCWIEDTWNNLHWIDGEKQVYTMFNQIKDIFLETYTSFEHYYRFTNRQHSATPVGLMNMSNIEYNLHINNYKNHCPVCKVLCGIQRKSEDPTRDYTNIIQVDDIYYWVCDDHLPDFIMEPELYKNKKQNIINEALPMNSLCLLPPEYEGICPVCFWTKFTSCQSRTKHGSSKFKVIFEKDLYCTCSEKCREMFILAPDSYLIPNKFLELLIMWANEIKRISPSPINRIQFSEFQVFAPFYANNSAWDDIYEAMMKVSTIRPKFPGISVKNSALIYFAYCLLDSSRSSRYIFIRFSKQHLEEYSETLRTGIQRIFSSLTPIRIEMITNHCHN